MSLSNRLLVVCLFVLTGAVVSSVLRYSHFSPPALNAYGFGSDSDVYWDLSGNLFAGRGYVSSPGMHPVVRSPSVGYLPNISTAPGYPVLLLLGRSAWNSLNVAYALQFFFYAGLVWMAACWNPDQRPLTRGDLLRMGAVAFWPGFLLQLQSVSSELAAAFFAALLVWSWRHTRRGSLFVASISAVCCVFLRSNLILFLVPWIVLEMILAWKQRVGVVLGRGAMVLLWVFVFYTGWSLRNQRLFGERAFSAYAGQVLYDHYVSKSNPQAPLPWSSMDRRESFVRERVAQGATWSLAERQMYQTLSRVVKDEIVAHPVRAVLSAGRAWAGFFLDSYFRVPDLLWARAYGLILVDNRKINPSDPALTTLSRGLYWLTRGLSLAVRAGILVVFLVCPFYLWREKEVMWSWITLWGGVFAFLAGTALISAAGDRQQLPVTCFVLFLVLKTLRLLGKNRLAL